MTNARDTQTITADIAKLVDEAHQRGYDDGYRAAVRNIMAAAASPNMRQEETTSASRTRSEYRNGDHDSRVQGESSGSRAAWGVSRQAIDNAMNADQFGRATIQTIKEAATKLGYSIAESSIRSMLGKMMREREIRKHGAGTWQRNPHASSSQNTADAAE
jgi:hypothetical protein